MMDYTKDFKDKVIIVTGSSSGIGEDAVIRFSSNGAKVVVTGRNGNNVKRVADKCHSVSPFGHKALQIVADVSDENDVKKIIDTTINTFGQIDVLVNNAGIGGASSIFDPNIMDAYDRIMKTDLRAVLHITHLAVPHLIKTKGNIVNISSDAGLSPISIGTLSLFSVYCGAKSALDMITKCLALELGPHGVRVNGINPAGVRTNFGSSMGMTKEQMEAIFDVHGKAYPLGRVGIPDDITKAILFLASNEGAFITGISMPVDGGALYCSTGNAVSSLEDAVKQNN